jgi:DNA polymerase-4
MEKISVDEAYLSVPQKHGLEIAREIQNTVRQELNLLVSIGVSSNKILAKMACELGKPGIKQVREEDVPGVIWPLPVYPTWILMSSCLCCKKRMCN